MSISDIILGARRLMQDEVTVATDDGINYKAALVLETVQDFFDGVWYRLGVEGDDRIVVQKQETLIASQGEYDLPADFEAFHTNPRIIDANRQLTLASKDEIEDWDSVDPSTPGMYCVYSDAIWIRPIPDEAGEMDYMYIATATTLSAGASSPLGGIFDAACKYHVWRILWSQDEYDVKDIKEDERIFLQNAFSMVRRRRKRQLVIPASSWEHDKRLDPNYRLSRFPKPW